MIGVINRMDMCVMRFLTPLMEIKIRGKVSSATLGSNFIGSGSNPSAVLIHNPGKEIPQNYG